MTQGKEVPTFSNLDSMSELIHDVLSPADSRKAFEAVALKQPFIKDVQRYDDDDRQYKGAYGHYDTKNAKVIWDEAVKWVLETLNERGVDLSIKTKPPLSVLAKRSPVSTQNDLADRGISSSQLRAYGIKPDEGDGVVPVEVLDGRTVRVLISGATATGKSALAFLFEQLLVQHEIPNTWVNGADEKNMNQMSFKNSLDLLRQVKANVLIEERTLKRPFNPGEGYAVRSSSDSPQPALHPPMVLRAFPKNYGDPITYVWDILVAGTNARPAIGTPRTLDESEYIFSPATMDEAMQFQKNSHPRLGVQLVSNMQRWEVVAVIDKQTTEVLGIVYADESKASGRWKIVGKSRAVTDEMDSFDELDVKASQHYMRPATPEEYAAALNEPLEKAVDALTRVKAKAGCAYHTRPKDTLPRIAREAYGDPDYWTFIFAVNQAGSTARLKHDNGLTTFVDLIQPHEVPFGMLWIPTLDPKQ